MTGYRPTRAVRPTRGLRGGWIAKRGKQVITAPAQWGCVGLAAPRPLSVRIALSTSALALGLVLGMGGVTPAAALPTDGCIETPPDVFICSGEPTVTQTITVTSGSSGTITTAPGFCINVTSWPAINIQALSGSNDVAFTDYEGSKITGDDQGISARKSGSGALSITPTFPK